jgi:hypothetical protein
MREDAREAAGDDACRDACGDDAAAASPFPRDAGCL